MSADTDPTTAAARNDRETDSTVHTDTIRGMEMTTDEYATTPVDKLKDTSPGVDVHLADWADYHGVMAWMLPFPHRNDNPVEIGKKITEKLDAFKDTAATFTRRNIDLADAAREIVNPLLYAHGAVQTDHTKRRHRFLNPNYIHYDFETDPIEDNCTRREFYTRYADIGTVSPNWIADHFGITTDGLRQWVARREEYQCSPGKRVSQAQDKIGKTAITLTAWHGLTRKTVSQMLGIPTSTLQDYVYRIDDSWNPPKSPAGNRWFGAEKGMQTGADCSESTVQESPPTSPSEVR